LSAKSCSGRRWSKKVIKACLGLWLRSPLAYENIKDSCLFILPSGRQLRRYKKYVPQEPGIHNYMLRWMFESAKQVNLPNEGYFGGLIHDETKIQQDLVWKKSGIAIALVGFVDTGPEGTSVKTLKKGKVEQTIASEVLQVTFVGYTGFRFPIAHFPTAGRECVFIIQCIFSQYLKKNVYFPTCLLNFSKYISIKDYIPD